MADEKVGGASLSADSRYAFLTDLELTYILMSCLPRYFPK